MTPESYGSVGSGLYEITQAEGSPKHCSVQPLGGRAHPCITSPALLTCVGPHMSLQVKGVIEALPTEGAQVPLHLTVALHMAVEHALQTEAFSTQLTVMHCGLAAGPSGELGGEGKKTGVNMSRQDKWQ